jgi:hypothetical protein
MILTAGPALADAASPWSPGDPVGVPSGAVQDVFIEHEDLSMDLSGLNASSPNGRPMATIGATYTLRNDGVAKGIDLIFITASRDVRSVEVVLDGAAIPAKVGPLGPVPPSWMPPRGMPNLRGGPDLPYNVTNAAGLAFHIDLGAGRHTMRTRYQARPTVLSGNRDYNEPVSWQLAFVLSPARQWKGFGDLDISVIVPPGWLVAVRPSLSRSGDVLSGHFDGIPADAIGVATEMRVLVPPDWRLIAWNWGLVGVLILSAIIGCVGARLIRWPLALVLFAAAPVFAFALAIAVGFGDNFRSADIPPAQQSWAGTKFTGLESLFVVVAAFVAGFALYLFGASVGIAIGTAWRYATVRPPTSPPAARPPVESQKQ